MLKHRTISSLIQNVRTLFRPPRVWNVKTGKMYYQFFHSCFIKSTNISKNVLTSDFQQNYASSNKTKENMNMRK